MARDITVTFSDGSKHVYKGAPDDVTPEQVQARATREFGKEVVALDGGRENRVLEGVKEVGRVVDKSVRKGAAALPGLIGDIFGQGFKALAEAPMGVAGPGAAIVQAVSRFAGNPFSDLQFGDVTKSIETLGGAVPVSEPKTSGGKAVANVLEPIVGTVVGGGAGTIGQKAVLGGMAGLGGEAAVRLTDDNPLARLVGSLVAGGATGVAQNVRGNSENLVRTATKHMTDADWRRAKVLEATLEKEGISHLKSQLLGPRSTLDDTVAIAGTNPTVRPKLTTAVENSSAQAQKALGRNLDQHVSIGIDEQRMALRNVQEAARNALANIRKKGNAAFRAKMPSENATYAPEHVQRLRDELIALAKDPRYGETSDGGKAILALADDLLEKGGTWDFSKVNPVVLGRAKKAGADLTQLPGAEFKRNVITNQHHVNNLLKDLNKKVNDPANLTYKHLPEEDVKRLFKQYTPEFDAAREAKTAVMTGEFNPASMGLAGDISRIGGGVKPDRMAATEQALKIVFPSNRAQPQAIRQLGETMGKDEVATLLREHLASQMSETVRLRLTQAEDVQGPVRFVQAVAGTKEQRANIEAALHVTAEANKVNPFAVRTGFYKLMRAFESFKDLKLPESVDRAALSYEAGKSIPGFAIAPHSRAGRWFWEKATAKTYDQIADLVTSKDGLKKLEAIAKSKSPETARQVALSVLLSSGAGENPPAE